MTELLSFLGIPLYIGIIWFRWSNKLDRKERGEEIEVESTFKKKLHFERQEIAITIIGAIIFSLGGEGILDTVCDFVDFFFDSNAYDLCTTIQVNNEELFHVLGGATFGTLGLLAVKATKKKINKKIDEI